MGADMLIALVGIEEGKKPDFEAGRKFIKRLKPKDLDLEDLVSQGLDEDEYFDDKGDPIHKEILKWLDGCVVEFQDALGSRAVTDIRVRGLHIYLTGGMSWGDANDEAVTFWRVGSIPGLLEAMNFMEDWDAPMPVTPAEEAAAIRSITNPNIESHTTHAKL